MLPRANDDPQARTLLAIKPSKIRRCFFGFAFYSVHSSTKKNISNILFTRYKINICYEYTYPFFLSRFFIFSSTPIFFLDNQEKNSKFAISFYVVWCIGIPSFVCNRHTYNKINVCSLIRFSYFRNDRRFIVYLKCKRSESQIIFCVYVMNLGHANPRERNEIHVSRKLSLSHAVLNRFLPKFHDFYLVFFQLNSYYSNIAGIGTYTLVFGITVYGGVTTINLFN